MNRVFTVIWNTALGAWVVASEQARRGGKGAGGVLATTLLLPTLALAADLPSGGQVVSGSGAISIPTAQQMVIDQASNKLAIDWQSFDIGSGNKVTFQQPGRDAIALNRVLGADGSKIMGQLDANGRVFLINPNGVLFGANAQVNVGGLVASTLDINDSDFAAGNYRFKGDGSNTRVINKGQITAADGGSVALLGGTVSNNGVIVANQGTVALAAGNAVTLDFAGDGLLNVQVDEAVKDALVENRQLIQADGGKVILRASAADALLQTVVNNTGVIQARTLGEKDGKIVLLGDFDGGTVQVAGTLDASAPNGGDGGFIDTSGAHVKVADGAQVTTKASSGQTGTWLIDPTDFSVSTGNASQSTSGIGASTLSSNLQNTSVTLATVASGSEAGDIDVNAAVSWNAGTTLTLSAHNDININAAITAQHADGKVALQYGQASADGGTADYHIKAPINLQSGNNFSTQKGLTPGTEITYTVVNDAAALQAMDSNLVGNYAVGSNIDLSSIANWQPVGNSSSNFTGRFDGLGHTLSNLTIERSATDYVGLFGFTDSASLIRDIGLEGGSVTGRSGVGGLVGYNSGGTISNAYATGSVSGYSYVGGLVGYNSLGTISNAYATGSISGSINNVGGLVGFNYSGTISNAYATGSVSGTNLVGGLVGSNSLGTISNAYATGNVSSTNAVGGLVGSNLFGNISNAYWDSTTTGQNAAVGTESGTQTNVNAVTSSAYSHNSYAILGTWAETIPGSGVWVATNSGGNKQWVMIEGSTRPFLYSEYSTTVSNAHQLQLMAVDLGASYTLSRDIDARETTGSNASGMWSTAGFSPVGNEPNPFTGSLDGNSHSVSDLTIKRTTHYAGLFGRSSGSISNLGLEGVSIEGFGLVGPLAGANDGSINNAYATGRVLGMDSGVGGLTGVNRGTINNAYARSNVTGKYRVGGLVGFSNVDSRISNAYATGNVTSVVSEAGGLVGFNAGSITQAYATGNVTGAYDGGLVGYNNGSISASFWLSSVLSKGFGHQGGTVSANSRGLTEVEATTASTFTNAGWDIASTGGSNAIWRIYDGHSAPLLRSFLQSITLNADASGGSKTYDGTAATGTTTYTSSLGNALDTSKLLGSLGYTSTSQNAGTYSVADGTLILNGLYSDQQGYDISYTTSGDVSLTIDKAALTVTTADASKTYDGQAFTGGNGVSYSGFVNGEDADVLDGTLTYGGSAQGAVNAGLYDLSVSGLRADNYAISYNAGSLTIDKALATVTANSSQVTYNGQQQSITGFTASGLVNGETADMLSGVSTIGGSGINAGTYTHSAGGTDGNYALTFVDGALTIDKAALTVTAADASKTYDGLAFNGDNGVSYSGFVNGENADVLDGTLTYGGSAQGAVDAGLYDLSISGLTSGNYAIDYAPGSLTIDKAQATVTANSGQVTYTGQQQGITGFTASGLVNGETADVLSSVSTTGGSGINVGSYTHSASGTDENYNLTFVDGALTIDKAALTVTAADASKTYDGLAFTGGNGVSYSGFVNGEEVDVLDGTLTYGGSAQGAVNAGLYDLNASGLSADNYAISYNAGSLTVDKAQATVTANSGQAIYNGQQQSITGFTATGLVNGETADVLSGVSTLGGSGINAGTYTHSASGTDDNYALTFVDGALTIDKAALAVTALNASKTYDGLAFTGGNGVSYSGFVNGEDADVLSGTLTYGGSAQGAVDAGLYDLNVSGLSADNYAISYNAGSLTIAALPAEISQPALTPAVGLRDAIASAQHTDNYANKAGDGESPELFTVVAGGLRVPQGL